MDNNLLGILKAGGPSMWIIGLCSVAALAVAIERIAALWGFIPGARSLADQVARALLRGDLEDARARCESSRSPAADMFLAGLVAAARPGPRVNGAADPDAVRIAAAVERERQQVGLRLRRSLWLLGTIGATAPFVGLFGTVWGIMHAFRQMALSGQGGFAVVAAGISEALITTAGGIAVAVEAVIFFNVFQARISKEAFDLTLRADELTEVVIDHAADLSAALQAPRGAPAQAVGASAQPLAGSG